MEQRLRFSASVLVMQELVDNPPALFVVRPGFLDTLKVMVCPGVVDQLTRLATKASVRESVRPIASCPPSLFEALTCALGFDSLNGKPLSDRLLWAAASRSSRGELVQEMRQDVIQLTDVLVNGSRWSTEQL